MVLFVVSLHSLRWGRGTAAALQQEPSMVARVIDQAMCDTSTRLRYPVGIDAERLLGVRRPDGPVDDATWLEQGKDVMLRDNATVRAWWQRHFGLDMSAGYRDGKLQQKKSKL
eukprot:m.466855 g.466855  ORF g.466855 m.466855 type:complete len:113 (+) comp21630_c0_seq45:1409-1747(+)